MRLPALAFGAIFLGIAVLPALAGDFATLETIGFSEDGKVFAFEQYGVHDGSGGPYSEIFFVDLDKDAFVEASPVRVAIEDDGTATIEDARRMARDKAAPLFERFHPERTPGLLAADNPVTEISADPLRVLFQPRAFEPWPDEPVELQLSAIPLKATGDCAAALGETIPGYRLVRAKSEGGGPERLLHEDKTVPESRGCPLDYRLSRILVHGGESDTQRAVALVGVKSMGFEGPDLRFIAAPVPLD